MRGQGAIDLGVGRPGFCSGTFLGRGFPLQLPLGGHGGEWSSLCKDLALASCSPGGSGITGHGFLWGKRGHRLWEGGQGSWLRGARPRFPWLSPRPLLGQLAPPSPPAPTSPPHTARGAAAWPCISISAPSASCPVAGWPLRKVLESSRPAGPGAGRGGLRFPPPHSSSGLLGLGAPGVKEFPA